MTPVTMLAVGVAAGFGGGWAFYAVWRRVLPRARSRVFWHALPVHTTGLIRSADPDETLRHYGALMKHTLTFALRNTLAVAAGVVPALALYLLTKLWNARAHGASNVTLGTALAAFDPVDGAFLAGLAAGSIAAAWRSARASRAAA